MYTDILSYNAQRLREHVLYDKEPTTVTKSGAAAYLSWHALGCEWGGRAARPAAGGKGEGRREAGAAVTWGCPGAVQGSPGPALGPGACEWQVYPLQKEVICYLIQQTSTTIACLALYKHRWAMSDKISGEMQRNAMAHTRLAK